MAYIRPQRSGGFKGSRAENNKIELEGFGEFIKAVQQLPDKMKAKTMRGIIAKNMQPIAKVIKANTPIRKSNQYQGTIKRKRKDGSISTESEVGNLYKSIGVRTFGNGKDVTGYAGIQKKKNDGWYGFFLERGTKHMKGIKFIERSSAIASPMAAENLSKDTTEYIINNAKKLGLDAK